MLRLALLPLVLLVTPALTADRVEVERLWRLLQMDDVIAIMREEGVAYGKALGDDMLDGTGGTGWTGDVSRIYDADAMTRVAQSRFAADLAQTDIAPMVAFFETDLGQRVITLENAARRAMLDSDVEEASRDEAWRLRDAGDARFQRLSAFVDAHDIIELNVVGAMNTTYAFYVGMTASAITTGRMTETDILTEVWQQEPLVRQDTEDWVMSFVNLAYRPLSDDDLAAFLAFADTPAGHRLNQAMFVAFDEMFVGISRALGRAVGQRLSGQEL